jgi:CheY-like chemotaxis protein
MKSKSMNILLVDSDKDNCLFFREALIELPISAKLSTMNSGEHLVEYLKMNIQQLPDVLFIDLNLPNKNGFECVTEIKENEKLKHLSIVIYSSTYPKYADYERKLIVMLEHIEGLHYISRPDKLAQLKIDIYQVIRMVAEKKIKKVQRRNMSLTTASY